MGRRAEILRTLTLLLTLCSVASLGAHHSLAEFDTTTAVRVKGRIVQIHYINPHSFIFVEAPDADGVMRRWAAEGPGIFQLGRRGFDKNELKVGDEIEICGYLPKERTTWQMARPEGGISLAGRLIEAENIVFLDGSLRAWSDYHFHKCFPPGYSH